MYNVRIPLHGIEESVTKRVVIGVANDIKRILAIPDDTYLQLDPRDNIKRRLNQLGEMKGDNNTKMEWCYIEATEESEPDNDLIITPSRPDMKPVYLDPDIDSKITPIYHTRKVNIEFKYYTLSKSDAFAKVNYIKSMTSNDSHTWLHDLEYFYNLGHFTFELMAEIYKLKNKRLSTALTYEEYLDKYFDERLDLALTDDGNLSKSNLIIKEAQLEVVGYIESDTYNIEAEYEEDKDQWVINLTYSFSYEKPICLIVTYPLLVFNSLIDNKFRKIKRIHEKRPNVGRSGRIEPIHQVVTRDDRLKPRLRDDYLMIPEIDKPILPLTTDLVTRMFCVLTCVDENDPTLLFNIKDIEKIRLKDNVLKYLLKYERDHVGDLLHSMFYFELFSNNERAYGYKILLDKDGILRTNKSMDLKKTYRVMFNVVNDLSTLDYLASKRLKKYLAEEGLDLFTDKKSKEGLATMYFNIFNYCSPETLFKNYHELTDFIMGYNTEVGRSAFTVNTYTTIIMRSILDDK